MPDALENKGAKTWRWILAGGAVGMVLIGAIAYGLLALAVTKGKPQIAAALGRIVEVQSGRLPPEALGLLRQLSAQAAEQRASLAAVWMLSQSVSGALADGRLSAEEIRLLGRVRDFVGAAGGGVGFKDAGAFMNADPALKKLLDEDGPATGRSAAQTTGTQRQ